MDLSGQTGIKTFWTYNAGTDMLTIVFKTTDEVTTLGDITIEGTRFRSLMEPMSEAMLQFFPDIRNTMDRKFHRSNFDNRTNALTTEFNL